MDYYNTLGVKRGASAEEIKRAYRSLAMKHHPDRGGDEKKFKEISEAYDVLGNTEKRQQYDNPQSFGFNNQGFGNGDPFEDIFAQAFGFGQRRQRVRRNRDIQIAYTLDLQECFTGKEININYKLPSGSEEYLSINIPPGARPGDTVKFEGRGDNSIPNVPRGDLLLQIRIRADSRWSLVGRDDLQTNITVSIFDLLTGSELEFKTPEGKTLNLKIPQGTAAGTAFSIPGHGLPNHRQGSRGKLIVKVIGSMPKINDQNIINKLASIKDEISKTSK
jgi:curved DNA-binding protein